MLMFFVIFLYALGQGGHMFTQVQGFVDKILGLSAKERLLLPHWQFEFDNATVCGMIRIERCCGYGYINGCRADLDWLSSSIPTVLCFISGMYGTNYY